MILVTMVDDYRMQLRPIWCAVLITAAPFEEIGVVVKTQHLLPGVAAIYRLEEALWRGTCIPGIGFAHMAGSQPKYMIDAALDATGFHRECRRGSRLTP